jgi:hypothetical protein
MDLRELARAYYDGLLDFDQYRHARTQLLDRVAGGPTTVPHARSSQTPPVEPVDGPAAGGRGAPRSYIRRSVWLLVLLALSLALLFWLTGR